MSSYYRQLCVIFSTTYLLNFESINGHSTDFSKTTPTDHQKLTVDLWSQKNGTGHMYAHLTTDKRIERKKQTEETISAGNVKTTGPEITEKKKKKKKWNTTVVRRREIATETNAVTIESDFISGLERIASYTGRSEKKQTRGDLQSESVTPSTQTSEKIVEMTSEKIVEMTSEKIVEMTSVNDDTHKYTDFVTSTSEVDKGHDFQQSRGILWWLAVVGGAGAGAIIILSALSFVFYRPWRRKKHVQLRKQPKRAIDNTYSNREDSMFVKDLSRQNKGGNSKKAGKEHCDEDRYQSVFSWATEFDASEPAMGEDRSSTMGNYANTTLLFTRSNLNVYNNDAASETDLTAGCKSYSGSTEPLKI